ncbi:nucleoside/nucleotide kinase family protein [Nocardia carnea]|uniref:nucleoside/nucleotide kinase family protein n=1 Tax=Nocardia carnea TaxID=37328 RepID=UPI00245492F2|nr:nucleoside/nucleotide kinase family protein [Nocardia carnea]
MDEETGSLVTVDDLARQVASAANRIGSGRRYLLGIAGPPAAGKSTVATRLAAALNRRDAGLAGMAPMDGFHRTTRELTAAGELERKGQPHTFDVPGFVARLRALRNPAAGIEVGWPVYDREIHDPVPDGVVFRRQRIVVLEGNYLLLDEPGWRDARSLLDECWYLDAGAESIERRLYERHRAGGKTPEVARAQIAHNDLPNATLVSGTRARADVVLTPRGEKYLVRSTR